MSQPSQTTDQWQPIDTAPKSHRVLGGAWVVQQGGKEWQIFESWFSSHRWVGAPTHWMPLPEPPK